MSHLLQRGLERRFVIHASLVLNVSVKMRFSPRTIRTFVRHFAREKAAFLRATNRGLSSFVERVLLVDARKVLSPEFPRRATLLPAALLAVGPLCFSFHQTFTCAGGPAA